MRETSGCCHDALLHSSLYRNDLLYKILLVVLHYSIQPCLRRMFTWMYTRILCIGCDLRHYWGKRDGKMQEVASGAGSYADTSPDAATTSCLLLPLSLHHVR
jgi:hypothetical protein